MPLGPWRVMLQYPTSYGIKSQVIRKSASFFANVLYPLTSQSQAVAYCIHGTWPDNMYVLECKLDGRSP